MGVCCVDGCNVINEDTVYFEFPTSRALRRKWMDVIKIPRKVPLGAVVCNLHFSKDDYETVRGKARLKRKVVPSRCLADQSEAPEECPPKAKSPRLDSSQTDSGPTVEDPNTDSTHKVDSGSKTDNVSKADSGLKADSVPKDGSDSKTDTGQNTESGPKAATGSKTDTGQNTESGPKVDSGQNIKSGPKVRSGSKVNSGSKVDSGLKTDNAPNADSGQNTESSKVNSGSKVDNISKVDSGLNAEPTLGSKSVEGPVQAESNDDEKSTSKTNGNDAEICKVVSKDSSGKKDVPKPPLPDLKQPADFEEMITNYQIKNKPNALHLFDMEVHPAPLVLPPGFPAGVSPGYPPVFPELFPPPEVTADGTIVVDDKEDKAPVFIEINVDKDNGSHGGEECLMVLESVQVDVDPAALLLARDDDADFQAAPPDRSGRGDEGDFDSDHRLLRPLEPISLVTSSDESDVIIEEPHIDTVEVSDATDEDDIPLVKLVPPPARPARPSRPTRKKRIKKQPEVRTLKCNVEFSCLKCRYKTRDSKTYNDHVRTHAKLYQILVCPICNYTTGSQTQFNRHMRKHTEEKKFRCHLCQYKARHNMALLYHLQSHEKPKYSEKKVKIYKCRECYFKTRVRDVMMKHKRACVSVSVGRVAFECDLCIYVTKRKSDLKRHKLTRHRDVEYVESEGEYVNEEADAGRKE
ncbi:uncharacterized protein LOC142985110 [Anticarsia gemmatalis]|uniref:uncharacterized protein LOC142985110 n=1 Tax=Anticarsia gemmatalis TaxID=129554 RepID=UPI003F75AC89